MSHDSIGDVPAGGAVGGRDEGASGHGVPSTEMGLQPWVKVGHWWMAISQNMIVQTSLCHHDCYHLHPLVQPIHLVPPSQIVSHVGFGIFWNDIDRTQIS